METLLQGIPHVSIYLDDIPITGTSEDDSLKTLDQVLNCLESAGLHLKQNEYAFQLPAVKYLGHKISDDLENKVKSYMSFQQNQKTSDVAPMHTGSGLRNHDPCCT